MSSPERSEWTPQRIARWIAVTVLVTAWIGPAFITEFRPPDGQFLDFSQEWLSARNYWAGTPVYADQTEALLRHTGFTPKVPEDMLPWNAHPPATIVLTLPFGKLEYRDAQFLWNVLTLPLFLISLWLIVRELDFPLRVWSIFPAITLLLLCNPVASQLGEGQLNFLLVFFITLAWVADRHDRTGWAGVALGIAAGIKLYPAFLFAYFVFTRRWRALLTGGVAFLVVNALALMVLGTGEFRTYIREVIPSLANFRSARWNVSITGFCLRIFNPQPHDLIAPLVVNPIAGRILPLICQLIITGIVVWIAWTARSTAARDRAFAVGLVGMVLVSPIAWTHYFVLLAQPVGLLWMRLRSDLARVAMTVVFVLLWLPVKYFEIISVGRERVEAVSKQGGRQLVPPNMNLTAFSVHTYALIALFILLLCLRVRPDEPASDSKTQPDEEQLNQRLFGPVG
jgi:Glycosyltransferase family 87